MKKFAHELDFISQIKRDGSGVFKIDEVMLKAILMTTANDYFVLVCLSISENTYIAFNFNAFVVRIKQ